MKTKYLKPLTLIRFALLTAFICLRLDAASLVVPPEDATTPASGSTFLFGPDNVRYIALYEPSHFLTAMPQGALITSIAFRLDESERSSLSATVPSLEIRMSTAAVEVPVLQLGSRFSSFVGKDEAVVVSRGSLTFSSNPASSGANPFDLTIPLQTPFLYDPRNGRLAIDIRIYQQANHTVLLDAGLAGAHLLGGDVRGDTVTGVVEAPIVNLGFQAVPEVSCGSLILSGLTFFGLTRAIRR